MMLVPRRNSFDLFDDFFKDDFFSRRQPALMKTDIKEKNDKYIIEMDLPGYLEISASVVKENNDDDDEKFVRQERYYGECSRSFYVGEDLTEEDIHAEFKNGILKIEVPKKEETKKLPKTKTIEIE